MLVTVLHPVLPTSSSEPARLVLPGPSAEIVDGAGLLRGALSAVAETGASLVVEAADRPHVSGTLMQAAVAALAAAEVVVVISPVSDTVRTTDGVIVDRRSLVEVGSPVVVSAQVVATLADHPGLQPSIESIAAAALGAGFEIATVPGDGSNGWSGAPDHAAVSRARVGR